MSRDRNRKARQPERGGREAISAAVVYLMNRYRDIIDDWAEFEAALHRPLAPCIWANPARIGADGLAALLQEEGVARQPLAGLPGAFALEEGMRPGQRWWFCAGLAHTQEAVSQLPVTLMDLAPGQRVLDMCAAPGGKTAQMAFALGNRGTLIANDFSTDRIRALQGNLDRLGILNVTTSCLDACNWPAEAGQYDRVLLDAPCSSEGTLRRNPGLAGRLGAELSGRLAARQRAMLRKAVQRCRPGGRILYSTCTFAPEENELVVRDILREYQGTLQLIPVRPTGWLTAPGITHWNGAQIEPELADCIRIWPHHNDTGGFFIALLEKDRGALADSPPRDAVLVPEPDQAWIEGLSQRFGLPEHIWTGFGIHRQSRRGLHLMAADHAPAVIPRAEGTGLFFLRTGVRPPKLTTAAAMLLGPRATRNRIELTAPQRDAYLRREEIKPDPSQSEGLRWGQVLASYLGHTLGVALYHRSGTLESLFPSRWSGCTTANLVQRCTNTSKNSVF